MSFKTLLAALAVAISGQISVAGEAKIMIEDSYARSSNPNSGAVFMTLMNHGADDDRLISASTDAAKRVELHTHLEDANGVMKMVKIEDGIDVKAGDMAALERGGDHVMLMGLSEPLKQGDVFSLTLSFEKAGDVTIEVPVDLERKPKASAHGGHDS